MTAPMTRSRVRSTALVIVNPTAGSVTAEFISTVQALCTRSVDDVHILTPPAADQDQISSAIVATAPDVVIAMGGDGTVRDVAEAMVRCCGLWESPRQWVARESESPALLVVPAGTGNSAYTALWGAAGWRQTLTSRLGRLKAPRRADLIRLREPDRAALLGVNFGLVADVAQRVQHMKASGDHSTAEQRYWAAFAQVLDDLRPFTVSVTVDDAVLHEGVASMVTVGGVRSFGRGMFKLLPYSVIDDGLLDVCVVEAHTTDEIAQLASLAPSGEHVGRAGVHYAQGRTITVKRTDGETLTMEHDGDPRSAGTSMTLEVMAGVVPFLADARSSAERG